MPKRVVDGEALWLSEKIRSLPEEYRLHYANWIPLAEANGVFEADAVRIHARIYSYIAPYVTIKKVRRIMKAFEKAGLLMLWSENGKTWGYFVGIEKTGRLPSIKHLERYSNLPPNPPIPDCPGEPGTSLTGGRD